MILKAINETKNEICEMKADVSVLKSDMSSIKDEMNSIKQKLSNAERRYDELGTRMDKMEESHANIQLQQDTLQADVGCLSLRDECTQDRLTTIEQQLDIIESERLRGSLRVFGIEET